MSSSKQITDPFSIARREKQKQFGDFCMYAIPFGVIVSAKAP